MGMTVVEKILARAAGRERVRPGDVLEPAVDLAMSHENAALVISQFLEVFKDTGREPTLWDPSKIVIVFDHRVPAESSKTASNQRRSVGGSRRATRWLAESAAAIGMAGSAQRSDSIVSMPSPAARTSSAASKRTAWPRRAPMARRGVSTAALPKPSGASQVRCAPVMRSARSVTAAIIAGQVSVGKLSSGR